LSNNYLFLAIIIIHYIIKYFKFSNFNQLSFFLSILILIRDWVLNNLITFLFHSHVHYFFFCCYKLYGLLNHPYNIAYVIAIHEKVSREISMSEKWKVKNEMWKVFTMWKYILDSLNSRKDRSRQMYCLLLLRVLIGFRFSVKVWIRSNCTLNVMSDIQWKLCFFSRDDAKESSYWILLIGIGCIQKWRPLIEQKRN